MPRIVSKPVKWFSLASFFFLLIALLLFGPGETLRYRFQKEVLTPAFGDPIDQTTRRLAGHAAINCGRVAIHGDPSEATSCSLAAQAKKQPFRVVYDRQGTDSQIADAIVRDAKGKLYRVEYDSCPAGCGFSIYYQRTYLASCAQQQGLIGDPGGRLTCPFSEPFDPKGVKHGPLIFLW